MKFIEWVVYSSKNADKISLTIKGVLVGLVPVLLMFFPQADFSTVIDQTVVLVQQILAITSTVMILYGGLRKLWTTFTGTNKVVN